MSFNLALPPTSLRQGGQQQVNVANGLPGQSSSPAPVAAVASPPQAEHALQYLPSSVPSKRPASELQSQQAAESYGSAVARLQQVQANISQQPGNPELLKEANELVERITSIQKTHGISRPPEAKILRATSSAPSAGGTDNSPSLPRDQAHASPPATNGTNAMVSGPSGAMTSKKLAELVNEVDPKAVLDPEVEQLLLEITDELIDSVTHFACKLARHRNSNQLQASDVALFLERNYHIRVPGFPDRDSGNSSNSIHTKRLSQGFYAHLHNRPAPISQHAQRVQLVKKAMLEESYRKEKEAKKREQEDEQRRQMEEANKMEAAKESKEAEQGTAE